MEGKGYPKRSVCFTDADVDDGAVQLIIGDGMVIVAVRATVVVTANAIVMEAVLVTITVSVAAVESSNGKHVLNNVSNYIP